MHCDPSGQCSERKLCKKWGQVDMCTCTGMWIGCARTLRATNRHYHERRHHYERKQSRCLPKQTPPNSKPAKRLVGATFPLCITTEAPTFPLKKLT